MVNTENDAPAATKTSESDAAQPNAPAAGADQAQSSGDQAQAGVGEHCVTDRPAPANVQVAGEIIKIADTDCYISKPQGYPSSPAKLLLFLSSGTGVHSPNNQLQADKYAEEGDFLVIMPDMFAGDPAPNLANPEAAAEEQASMLDQIKMRAAETAQSFVLDMWLARQTPEKVLPLLHKVIDAVKSEFADAVTYGDGLYAVGYCFGGKYVLLLSGSKPSSEQGQADEESQKPPPVIKAGALAHGTQVTVADLQEVKCPVGLVCVENDPLFPSDVLEAGRKKLEESKIDHEIEVYPNVPHGFAVVGEYEEQSIKDAQKKAFTQMLAWLTSH